jgi:GTP-dependent phosphoenolpyruvate carboxykinase
VMLKQAQAALQKDCLDFSIKIFLANNKCLLQTHMMLMQIILKIIHTH